MPKSSQFQVFGALKTKQYLSWLLTLESSNKVIPKMALYKPQEVWPIPVPIIAKNTALQRQDPEWLAGKWRWKQGFPIESIQWFVGLICFSRKLVGIFFEVTFLWNLVKLGGTWEPDYPTFLCFFWGLSWLSGHCTWGKMNWSRWRHWKTRCCWWSDSWATARDGHSVKQRSPRHKFPPQSLRWRTPSYVCVATYLYIIYIYVHIIYT